MGQPCVDAQVLLGKGALRSLLQLPDGWITGEVRVRNDEILEIDVVFPDGPSDLPPVHLVPLYRKVWHADGQAITLDRITVIAQVPSRPVKRARRRLGL